MPSPTDSTPGRPQRVTGCSLGAVARHLAEQLVTPVPQADPRVVATGVTLDSRAVVPGDLYAAVAGSHAHGAHFASDAAAAGAVAALTDRDGEAAVRAAGLPAYVVAQPRQVLGPLAALIYGNPSADLKVVGVTGTNGKTTVSYFVEAGLREAGLETGLIGTIETRIAGVRVSSVRTTPEAPELQAMLAVMRERDVAAVAMEVSSHALAMGRVDGTAYDVGVFTNLTPDHLDFHRDLHDYFAAKARLFTPALVARGVINVDDPHGERLARSASVPVVTFSPSGRADAVWRVRDTTSAVTGSRFRLEGPKGLALDVSTQLAGSVNVDNAGVAVVALAELGIDPRVAAAGVAALPEVPGRMQRVDAGQDFVAVVDYAHTPDALQHLLSSLREVTARRLIVVFGCGGDRDPYKRPVMGEIAARAADVVVVTSDSPRSEDPGEIIEAVVSGASVARGSTSVEVVGDRRDAIWHAVELAGPGDVVVVAGKGHEQGQEIGGVVHPFDDATVLRAAIGATCTAAGGGVS